MSFNFSRLRLLALSSPSPPSWAANLSLSATSTPSQFSQWKYSSTREIKRSASKALYLSQHHEILELQGKIRKKRKKTKNTYNRYLLTEDDYPYVLVIIFQIPCQFLFSKFQLTYLSFKFCILVEIG